MSSQQNRWCDFVRFRLRNQTVSVRYFTTSIEFIPIQTFWMAVLVATSDLHLNDKTGNISRQALWHKVSPFDVDSNPYPRR